MDRMYYDRSKNEKYDMVQGQENDLDIYNR